jgi:RNA polymerase sigma factor (sigma-70 family)
MDRSRRGVRHRIVSLGAKPGPESRAAVVVRDLEDGRDRDLVRRLAGGDEEAFRALFRRHGPMAHGLALRLVRQRFIAEEIVQEAFLALWRDPGAYREDRGNFRSWLMSAVHHRAVDAVRREEAQRRRTRDAAEAEVVIEDDVGEKVVEEADLVETRNKVRAALQEIPVEQRRVLELMYFEGKTQSMIAEELSLPLGTVKSRTLLGMRRLRGMVGKAGGS